MNKKLSLAMLLLVVAPAAFILAGCSDETKADPAVVENMNKQRAAQDPSKSGAPAGAPGTAPGAGAPGAATPTGK